MNSITLDPYLRKQVELGMDGADIMHGHLKTMMYEAEKQLAEYADNDDEQYDQQLIVYTLKDTLKVCQNYIV